MKAKQNMTEDFRSRQLLDTVEAALMLVVDYADGVEAMPPAMPLPSLLIQCQQMIAETQVEPLRLVHHFACTGGTVLAKCLAALPNVSLLSEIDPLSMLLFDPRKPSFAPTDLVLNARYASPDQDEGLLTEVFLGGLMALRDGMRRKGRHLVLRDHAHSQFCTARDPASRLTLRDMIPPDIPLRSVVTLRNPIESYLSLVTQGWHLAMTPGGISDYARRYLAFLERHEGLPWLRYEDFLADPAARLADLCLWLDLPFSSDALELFSMIQLSGDSGRSGSILAPRPPRPIPENVQEEIRTSSSLRQLCGLMGYDFPG